jgi:hypothetical protein
VTSMAFFMWSRVGLRIVSIIAYESIKDETASIKENTPSTNNELKTEYTNS